MTDRTDSTALATFKAALLEPLPEPLPTDTHHNRLLRQARNEAWRKATVRVNYQVAASAFGQATIAYAKEIDGDARTARKLTSRTVYELMEDMEQAIVDLMLTPAPDQWAVRLKRTAMRGNKSGYFFLRYPTGGHSAEELAAHRSFVAKLEAAIDADLVWLAAHPVRTAKASAEGGAAMTDADGITNQRDRFGRPLDLLNRIEQLNRARIFLDATALLLETLGKDIEGLNAVLANLNAADEIVAEVARQLEAEWDAAKPG